jgi:hypothetical protein
MPLEPFEKVQPEPLTFPVGQHKYTIPPLGYLKGVRLQGMLAGTDHTMDTKGADALWEFVLGDVWEQMKADDAPIEAMTRIAFATLADVTQGREMAEKVWKSGIPPEALAAAMAAIQATAQPTQPSTVAAPKTRQQASSSGTSSRRASTRKAAVKAKASRS